MKADQSSLYRLLETLHFWCLTTFENAPKNVCIQKDISIVVENVVQAQSAVALALQTENPTQKLDLLDVVNMSITNVKTITKVLSEYSEGNAKGQHVIPKSSRVRLLDIMAQIANELGRWRNRTLSTIASADTH